MSDNTQAVERLPCPFCGRSAAVVWNSGDGCWSVECWDGDSGCAAEVMRETEVEAIAAWNTRAALTSPPPPSELLREIQGILKSPRVDFDVRVRGAIRLIDAALRTAPIEPRPAEGGKMP